MDNINDELDIRVSRRKDIAAAEENIRKSPLFKLDRDTPAFDKEENRMIEYIYFYALGHLKVICKPKKENETKPEIKYAPEGFADEISETAKRIIKAYKPEKGDIIHYISKSLSKMYKECIAKEINEDKHMGYTFRAEKAIRKYLNELKKSGIDIYSLSEKHLQENTSQMDRDIKCIHEFYGFDCLQPVSPVISNEDGEETSIFDCIPDESVENYAYEEAERIENHLAKIEKYYLSLQKRTQPKFKAWIWISRNGEIFEIIHNQGIDASKYPYIDLNDYNSYIAGAPAPTQREIAERFYCDEASISRIFKKFSEDLKDFLRGSNNG